MDITEQEYCRLFCASIVCGIPLCKKCLMGQLLSLLFVDQQPIHDIQINYSLVYRLKYMPQICGTKSNTIPPQIFLVRLYFVDGLSCNIVFNI